MQAIEQITADPKLHTGDLGGQAKTVDVTSAVVARLKNR
jgi:tartrate dehydrogenase/decarboxylase/D-malate dehydrogenase